MSTTPELAEKFLMQTGRRLPVTFVRGRGCLVYDESGREYLDMVAGIAVNLLGHAHPDVAAAVARQAQTLIHTAFSTADWKDFLTGAGNPFRGRFITSMIVTLGGLFFYRGLVYVTTHGAVTGVPQAARENWLAQLFGGHWLRIENGFLLLLLLGFLCAVTLYQTRFGNHLLALGGDPASAESQGVPVNRVRTLAFCLCSFFAGLSACQPV